MDSSNFLKRVLHRLAGDLELPELTFQIIRRTIATLGKTKGHVKDIQGMMRHSKASTTTDVYMQSLEPEVRSAINSIYTELMGVETTDLLPQPHLAISTNSKSGSTHDVGARKRKIEGQRETVVSSTESGAAAKASRGVVLEFATKM